MSNPLRSIPRGAVKGYLRAVRFPVDVAAKALRRDDSRPWRPAVAAEALQAKATGLAGSLLRDDELQATARVQTARVEQLRKAVTAADAAEAKEAVADREQAQREQAAEAKQQAAAKRRSTAKERIAEDEAKAKADARQRASRQKRTAAEAERRRKEAVAEKAREAKAESLEAKREALLKKKQATQARAPAREIGDAAEKTRRRRTG